MLKQEEHVARVIASVTSGTAAAQSRLAASWQRSYRKHGICPTKTSARPAPDTATLRERRERLERCLHVAKSRLDDLFAMLSQCGCGVFLTDADGVVLDGRTFDGDAAFFRDSGLTPGIDWSEAAQGTNGIGTCLAEGRAITIHRDQHYLPGNIAMSCIDAPVFGPDGTIIAALDVSSARADQTEGFNRLIEGMVVQVSRQIEIDLFQATYQKNRIVIPQGERTCDAALLAVDDHEVVVGATRDARRLFDIEPTGPIKRRPLVDLTGRTDGPCGFQRAERAALIRALTRTNGNASQAARSLGIGRATLYRRLKRLGISQIDA